MTLDEARKHCLDIADGQDKCADISVSEHAKERIRECANDHRQLAEWLTELKEAKRLLKSATKVLNSYMPCDEDYNCTECIKQGQNCDYDDRFKWLYADEALALIGEDGEQNG